MSKSEISSVLAPEIAVEILSKTLETLNSQEYIKKLDEAKVNVGNEMLKMMQFIFPIVMQVELEIIKDYGFPESREGIVKFAQIIRNLERENNDVARLHGLIKAYYMPPVSAPTNNQIEENLISS